MFQVHALRRLTCCPLQRAPVTRGRSTCCRSWWRLARRGAKGQPKASQTRWRVLFARPTLTGREAASPVVEGGAISNKTEQTGCEPCSWHHWGPSASQKAPPPPHFSAACHRVLLARQHAACIPARAPCRPAWTVSATWSWGHKQVDHSQKGAQAPPRTYRPRWPPHWRAISKVITVRVPFARLEVAAPRD